MNIPTRRTGAALLAAGLAVSLAACGDDASDGALDEPQAATLVLDWAPNTNHGGIYLAEANGWYDELGIDLSIIQPGETGADQAVASGNAEFAISYQENVTPARAQGVPIVSIAAILEENTSSMMALTSSGIDSPADFAGQQYGGFGGQLESELISALVECDGGDPDAVDIVEVGNTDYRVGLETDAFDFVWIFEGWDKIRLEQAGVDITTVPLADYQDCIPNWYTPLIATSEALIDDNPELISAFMDATARGYREAMENPEAAADALLAAAPELDEELVRASAAYLAENFASDPDQWGQQDAEVWTGFTEFLVSAGMLDETIDVDAAYTNEFLK